MPGYVNLMILGAQKCATTSLYDMLVRSDIVASSKKKELDFFSETESWQDNLETYHRSFSDDGEIRLDASPGYTMYPHKNLEIWDDIHSYNPEMKFIYLVRNPLDRMKSAYKHNFERGYVDMEYEDFLLNHTLSINCSRYAMQIEPFIETFGRERVLIMSFDDLVRKPQAVLPSIAALLGVDAASFARVPLVHSNSASHVKFHHRHDNPALPLKAVRKIAPPLFRKWARANSPKPHKPIARPEVRRAFLAMIANDIDAMERLTGWDLSAWRQA